MKSHVVTVAWPLLTILSLPKDRDASKTDRCGHVAGRATRPMFPDHNNASLFPHAHLANTYACTTPSSAASDLGYVMHTSHVVMMGIPL